MQHGPEFLTFEFLLLISDEDYKEDIQDTRLHATGAGYFTARRIYLPGDRGKGTKP